MQVCIELFDTWEVWADIKFFTEKTWIIILKERPVTIAYRKLNTRTPNYGEINLSEWQRNDGKSYNVSLDNLKSYYADSIQGHYTVHTTIPRYTQIKHWQKKFYNIAIVLLQVLEAQGI